MECEKRQGPSSQAAERSVILAKAELCIPSFSQAPAARCGAGPAGRWRQVPGEPGRPASRWHCVRGGAGAVGPPPGGAVPEGHPRGCSSLPPLPRRPHGGRVRETRTFAFELSSVSSVLWRTLRLMRGGL